MANVIGTAGNDLLNGDFNASNTIDGLQGDDTINGSYLNDTLTGSEGNDQISGNGGIDLINGDAGNDLLITTNDYTNATLNGGLGDDIFDIDNRYGSGLSIDGGAGTDLLKTYSAPYYYNSSLIIDLNNVDFATLSLPNIKSIQNVEGIKDFTGGEGADVVTASGSSTIGHFIDGRGGDDSIVGGAGNVIRSMGAMAVQTP